MSKIRNQVMASVVVIHTWRQVFSATALKAYGLLAAFAVTASMVSVGNVIQNFLSVGLDGAGKFILYALIDTAGTVQFFTFAMLLLGLLLARDIIRSAFRSAPSFA